MGDQPKPPSELAKQIAVAIMGYDTLAPTISTAGLADLEARLAAAEQAFDDAVEREVTARGERDEAWGRLELVRNAVACRSTWHSFSSLLLEIGRLATEPALDESTTDRSVTEVKSATEVKGEGGEDASKQDC